MKIKDMKKIIELVSANGLINEFILSKDGKVNVKSDDGTFMVDLIYNGISLPEDIGIDSSKKMKAVLGRVSEENELELKDNKFFIKNTTTEAKIPRRAIDTIKPPQKFPELTGYLLEIPNVPKDKLEKSIKNRVEDIFEQYDFQVQSGVMKIITGNEETGTISEDIISAPPDKNMLSRFSLNIPEVIKTLEKNPNIRMGNAYPMEFSVTTEQYSVKYLCAPRTETK